MMYHIPGGTKGVISATSKGPVRIPPPLPAPPGPDMYDPRLLGEAITSGRPDIGEQRSRYHIPTDRPWWARFWIRIVIWLAG